MHKFYSKYIFFLLGFIAIYRWFINQFGWLFGSPCNNVHSQRTHECRQDNSAKKQRNNEKKEQAVQQTRYTFEINNEVRRHRIRYWCRPKMLWYIQFRKPCWHILNVLPASDKSGISVNHMLQVQNLAEVLQPIYRFAAVIHEVQWRHCHNTPPRWRYILHANTDGVKCCHPVSFRATEIFWRLPDLTE